MIRLVEMIQAKKMLPRSLRRNARSFRRCEDKRLSKLLPPGGKVAHKTGSVLWYALKPA